MPLDNLRERLEKASNNPKKLVKAIDDLYTHFMDISRWHRLQWLVCSAFIRGQQNILYDSDTRGLVSVGTPKGIRRSKANIIKPWAKHLLARIVAVKPASEVIPRDMSPEQIAAAQAGTAFLQQNDRLQNARKKRHKLGYTCIHFGNAIAYLRHFVDETKQIPIPVLDEVTGDPIYEGGEPKVAWKAVEDVDREILPPHHCLTDLEDSELEDKPEVILTFFRSLEYFKNQYPKNGSDVQPDKFSRKNADYDLSLLSGNRFGFGSSRSLEGAVEKIYMQKPSRQHLKGKVIITAGQVLLLNEEWPYKYMRGYPLVHYRLGPQEPGDFWTLPPVLDFLSLQKDMNESISIVQENIANAGHKKVMNPTLSGVESINDMSSEIVDYEHPYEPHQWVVTALPEYLVNNPSRLMKIFEDVSMQHSATRGEGTPNVRSAIGLDKLEEEDTRPLSIIDDFFSASDEEASLKTLQIAAEKLTIPRLVKYVGEGRKRTIDNFVGEMLDPMSTIQVRMVDEHLRNKGATQNTILQLFQAGVVGVDSFGKPDMAEVKHLLRWAIPDMMFDKQDQQRDIAYDENELLMKGKEVQAQEWEDQFVHLDVVEELLNSPEVKARAGDEEFMGNIIEHRTQHIGLILKAMQQTQPVGEVEEGESQGTTQETTT